MNSNTDYWYSAPEAVPNTSVENSLPEPVHIGAANTVNTKADLWPLHPDQYLSGTPKYQQTVEGQHSEGRNLEGGHPEERYLDAQHPGEHHSEGGHRKADTRKHVCGLRAGLFWTVLIVITVVIVGAAVGIGVGVSLARRSESVDSSSPSSTSVMSPASTSPISTGLSSSASVTPTTTTTQSTSVTTTSIVGPSSTLFRDCPSSDNTTHDVTLGSKTYIYRKFCNTVLTGNKNGVSIVNQATIDLNTCINRCALHNDENASEIAAGDTNPWYGFYFLHLPFLYSFASPEHFADID